MVALERVTAVSDNRGLVTQLQLHVFELMRNLYHKTLTKNLLLEASAAKPAPCFLRPHEILKSLQLLVNSIVCNWISLLFTTNALPFSAVEK